MTSADPLAGLRKLALDTAPIIYFIEAHSRYVRLMRDIFRAATDGTLALATSAVTLTEVLVQPLRRGDAELAAKYAELLQSGAGCALLPIDAPVAEAAARLRAAHGLRTPDALLPHGVRAQRKPSEFSDAAGSQA